MAEVAVVIAAQIAEQIAAKIAGDIVTVAERLGVGRARVSKMMNRLIGEIRECQAQLEDAEKRQVNDGEVKEWLGNVKDVYYDMIDVFEEWTMESKARYLGTSLYFLGPLGKYLYYKDFEEKIDTLVYQMQKFRKAGERNLKLDKSRIEGSWDAGDSWQRRSVVVAAKVYGRDDETGILRRKLVDGISIQQGFDSFALVGKAGIGKTTLAQTVYKEPDVDKCFDLKVWINVSNDFNLFRIARIIIQSAPDTASAIPVDEVELQVLLQRVRQIIEDKKFLFVLDDVKHEDDALWQELRAICKHGAPGSMMLITTRKDIVAHNAGCKAHQIMRLCRLSDQDCWLIIRDYALDSSTEELKTERPDSSADEFEGETPLTKVGREIANKCEGLPVLAKSLAGILRSRRSVQEWLEVLEIDMWITSTNHDHPIDVTPSLMLSYYFLPNVLRQCLLYCSIFPKDHIIDVDKLIKLWIAQGYFESHHDKMEAEAGRCFKELLNRSFFHELKKDDMGNLTCKLVGAISDFIQFLAENECLILDADDKTEFEESNSFTKARHWTLKVESQASLPGFIGNTSKLHTLMVLAEYSYTDPITLSSLLSHFRRLRALDLSYCSVRELPIKAGSLLHLRYLDLSFNRDLTKLPKVICDLSLLQTLNLNGCDSLRKLPKGIGKLSRLRHLQILWTKSLSYLPKGISSLTSLCTLNRFIGNDTVHSKACTFGELKELKHLQGCISIDGLGGGTDVDQAKEACLKKKEGMLGLELWFSGLGYEGIKDVEILEALEPPPKLQCLGIHYYKATSFPCWITTLEHLTELILSDCNECDILPALGKLKHLQAIYIRNMTKLQKLGAEFLGIQSDGEEETDSEMCVFPELKKLQFHMLIDWEEWEEIPERGKILSIMPQLSSMSITSCTKIKALPRWITTLEHLTELMLSDCNECVTLPALGKLKHLQALDIRNMTKLQKVGAEFLGIQSDGEEETDSEMCVFPKLEKLHFHMLMDWEEWEEIPAGRSNILSIMPQLSSMSITSCTKIKALPNYIKNKMTENWKPILEDCPLLQQ